MSAQTLPARLRHIRMTIVLGVAVVALGAGAFAHAAAPATWSNEAPIPGSSTSAVRPPISVQVFDEAGPRNDSATYLKVDGRSYRPKVTYFRNPDGSYNYSRATISYTPAANLARVCTPSRSAR